jgi:hypothetical protein
MKYFLIGLLLISAVTYGQEYKTLHMLPDSELLKTVVGKRITYSYKTFTIEGAGKILKVRQNKKMIFADEGSEEQKSIIPHIFLTGDSLDNPVLVIDLYSEALYGFNIYILNGLESVKVGFIPVAMPAETTIADQENIPSSSIVEKIIIETDGKQMRVSFSADKLLLRPGTGKEEIVNGDQVKFLFNGKKLKEVEEF